MWGNMIPTFCKNYLAMQGVIIMPPTRVASMPIKEEREKENVPIVAMYERGNWIMQKSTFHDIEEYHYQPSCFDGFDFPNIEWDRMEYEDYAERMNLLTVEVHHTDS